MHTMQRLSQRQIPGSVRQDTQPAAGDPVTVPVSRDPSHMLASAHMAPGNHAKLVRIGQLSCY